jgi:hypothetical protein
MRIPVRLVPNAQNFAVIASLVMVVGLSGACEDLHIGRPCSLGVSNPDAGASGATATITSPALECPSRICLLPVASKNPMGAGPLCTAGCESNSDCEDGEGGPLAGGHKLCKTGFVCMYPTTVGAFCCQRMCVCRDFVTDTSPGITKPAVCNAPSECVNVK